MSEPEIVTHPQLSATHSFEDSDSPSENELDANDQPIPPITPAADEPETIRVGRPVPPIDFSLASPVKTPKDLNQLAFRYLPHTL